MDLRRLLERLLAAAGIVRASCFRKFVSFLEKLKKIIISKSTRVGRIWPPLGASLGRSRYGPRIVFFEIRKFFEKVKNFSICTDPIGI